MIIHLPSLGLGVKYVSDQRTLSELIDGEVVIVW